MNTHPILKPRPLRRKSISVLKDENISPLRICLIIKTPVTIIENPSSSPFKLADFSKATNSKEILKNEKFFSNQKILKNSTKDNNFLNNSISNFEVDFQTFQFDLQNEIKDSEAKDEILSILSTEHNETETSTRISSVRSSMPPLRPQNPFLKNFSHVDLDDEGVNNNNSNGNSILRHMTKEKNIPVRTINVRRIMEKTN